MRSVVWTGEAIARALRARLTGEIVVVDNERAFREAAVDFRTVAFVDQTTVALLDPDLPTPSAVIAICEEPIQAAIGWIASYPWLSHVVAGSMLEHPLAAEHLANVTNTLTSASTPRLVNWLAPEIAGRRVRLSQAHKRVDRLEKMSAFFESKGVGGRTIELLRDAAEELLTNAFYDAPVAAGVVDQPISRTQDVSLPEAHACDMVYGCRDDLAVVRVRDPFGSLSRTRLVEVLSRCARTDMRVEVDETMGGAGLGLWRIFTVASFVAISVVNNRQTEFLVGIAKRTSGPRPFAFHLFFKEPGQAVRRWKLLDADTSHPSINNSITIFTK